MNSIDDINKLLFQFYKFQEHAKIYDEEFKMIYSTYWGESYIHCNTTYYGEDIYQMKKIFRNNK